MRLIERDSMAGIPQKKDPLLSDILLLNAIQFENMLAESAFARRAGMEDPFSLQRRESFVEFLDDVYCRYGISKSFEQTRQLVEEFEAAAAKSAGTARAMSR